MKILWMLAMVIFTSMFFATLRPVVGSAAPPIKTAGEDTRPAFAEKYRAYQSSVRAGKAAFDWKDYPKAIEHYSKAAGMSPFDTQSYLNRGIAQYRLGRWKEAAEDFDRALVIDPRIGKAYAYRGLCRMKTSAYQAALYDYKKALKLEPNNGKFKEHLRAYEKGMLE